MNEILPPPLVAFHKSLQKSEDFLCAVFLHLLVSWEVLLYAEPFID